MRVTAVVLVLFLWWGMMPFLERAEGQPAGEQTKVLDTFETDQPLSFPRHWRARSDEKTAKAIYRVAEEEGNRFLHAYAKNQDEQIGLSRSFQPQPFPVLQWRWRVQQIPRGGDERTKDTNNSAAAVYILFDSTWMPRAIKYVWSSSLPVGTRIKSPVYWRAWVVVLQSGTAHVGQWHQEAVNFYQDYKDFFGAEPGEVKGIAILTDSQATNSVAEADYDDFTLVAARATKGAEKREPTGQAASAMGGEQNDRSCTWEGKSRGIARH